MSNIIPLPRPLLLLTFGMAGSGKSTLARELETLFDLTMLRSDVVHKQLQGVDAGKRLKTGFLSGAYSQEKKAQTYVELLNLATDAMETGNGAIVDASMLYPYMRDPFRKRIEERGWNALFLMVSIGDEESKKRLDIREAEGTDASDATYEIYLKQKAAFTPPTEMADRIEIDGKRPLAQQIQQVVEAVEALFQ